MKRQKFEVINHQILEQFQQLKRDTPERLNKRLNMSWSNWMFGIEPLSVSAERLQRNNVKFIELHGNHYGNALGYEFEKTIQVLNDYNLKVSGVCGMFSTENDLSSNKANQRQAAIEYLKREIDFTSKVGGHYLLVVPGAVGRPKAYDDCEFERSVETLKLVADLFGRYNVKAAIEPIRSAEVSFIHTVSDALNYIRAVNHEGVQWINGDVYHMQSEEVHIGDAIIQSGNRLINLHLADSNRGALGDGAMDLDTIIRALYIIGFNEDGRFLTPEPLGPGSDPYPAMFGKTEKSKLDKLVTDTISYFREREEEVLANL